MRRLWVVIALGLFAVAGGVSGQEVTPEVTVSIDVTPEVTPVIAARSPLVRFVVDGLNRSYVLHVPPEIDAPAPLVIMLHGRFGSGAGIETYTAFDRVADEEGFIIAYPDAFGGEWNYVEGVAGYPSEHDDIAFLHALIDHIAAAQPVDPARIYLTGFSNGGFMVQRMACQYPERFAGFASVSAAAFGGMSQVCADRTAVPHAPMLMIHGTADDNIPWDGTPISRDGQTIYITYPVVDTFGYWASRNECGTDADTRDLEQLGSSPGTNVRVLSLHCPDDTAVVLYAIINGGHNWARPDQQFYPELGIINRDMDTAREIWDFFAPLSREQLVHSGF
ncbi:MAG: prolyl oligopeptidase family serine peptidase [Anaerolinea sp.]|nr:prolyl oligopeptidase family serine peptidase [Anaerolinea sp.]